MKRKKIDRTQKMPPIKVANQSSFNRIISKTKWALVELMKIYSAKTSYFSKKRLESGVGFLIAEWGMIFWLMKKTDVMDTYDFAIWASIQFLVAGYMVKQIQKQKVFDQEQEDEDEEQEQYQPTVSYQQPYQPDEKCECVKEDEDRCEYKCCKCNK